MLKFELVMKPLELKGKINKDCKIFTTNVEDSAKSLIYNLLDHRAFENIPIRIMPDVHCGKGIVIGFSAPIGNMISPAHVGCDIGCGIETFIMDKNVNPDDFALIEHRIKKEIPFGFDINPKRVFEMKDFIKFMKNGFNTCLAQWSEMIDDLVDISEEGFSDMCNRIGMDEGTFYKSISSFGGGNHFCEIGVTPDGKYAFTIHCGSRNFGVKVFKYWDKIASSMQYDRAEYREMVKHIKKTAKNRNDIPKMIAELQAELEAKSAPNGYLMGDNMKGYITDMCIAQLYAQYNRNMIAKKIEEIFYKINQAKVIERITSIHNYIDLKDHIIRKGAIRSYEGEKMVIPFNMKDGLAICEGKTNADWNFTAPHGAGRLMSRAAAKKNLSMEEFKSKMDGIYTTSVCKNTIDESPMAYKPMEEIIEAIEPTCNILYMVKPVINIKDCSGNSDD